MPSIPQAQLEDLDRQRGFPGGDEFVEGFVEDGADDLAVTHVELLENA
jgi:hypothetical protein